MLYSRRCWLNFFLLPALLCTPFLLLKAGTLPPEYGGYELSYVQGKLSDSLITISGEKDPNKIPGGLVLKNAFAMLSAEESIAGKNETEEINPYPHMTQLRGADEEVDYRNSKEIIGEMCRLLKSGRANNVKAVAQLAMDAQIAEMRDLENFYRNKIQQLPPEKARKIESFMPEIRNNISYSYSDYVSLAEEVPEVIYMLLLRGCRQRGL